VPATVGGPPHTTRRPRLRVALPVLVAAAVVAADQVTKTWALHHTVRPRHILGPVTFQLTFNSGAAFGLGSGVTPVVEALVVVLVIGLVAFGRRATRRLTTAGVVGLGLLLGGALGNLTDRFIRSNHGAVIDFIAALRIGDRDWWPLFNVADAAIVVGAILLALTYARRRPPADP
jgi:signal peptidase II